MEKILKFKFPKCLHIADKHFGIGHEHLPLGHGDLDFELIFKKYLKVYHGRIIFEVVDTDEAIIQSKRTIQNIINS